MGKKKRDKRIYQGVGKRDTKLSILVFNPNSLSVSFGVSILVS